MDDKSEIAVKTAFFLAAIAVTLLGLCLGFQEIDRIRENFPFIVEHDLLLILWSSGWWRVMSVPLTTAIFVAAFILAFVKDQKGWGIMLVLFWTIFAGVVGMFLWMYAKFFIPIVFY